MIGKLGMIERHYEAKKKLDDVTRKGANSEHWEWAQGYYSYLSSVQKRRVERYNKMPKWLRWIFRNPDK